MSQVRQFCALLSYSNYQVMDSSSCVCPLRCYQVVAGGEKWASMVKVGYNLKRAWVLYKQCKKKLQQLHREWVVMGGSLQGELSGTLRVNYDSDEEDLETVVAVLYFYRTTPLHMTFLPSPESSNIQGQTVSEGCLHCWKLQGVGTSVASSQDLQQRAAEEGWETRQRRASDPPMVELGEHQDALHLLDTFDHVLLRSCWMLLLEEVPNTLLL